MIWLRSLIISGLSMIGITTAIAVNLIKQSTWGLIKVIWINIMVGFIIFMGLEEQRKKGLSSEEKSK